MTPGGQAKFQQKDNTFHFNKKPIIFAVKLKALGISNSKVTNAMLIRLETKNNNTRLPSNL